MDDSLCQKCKKVNFLRLLRDPNHSTSSVQVQTIGKSLPPSRDLLCPLCQLFHAHRPTYKTNFALQVRSFQSLELEQAGSNIDKQASYAEILPEYTFLSVVRKDSRLQFPSQSTLDEVRRGGVIGLLRDSQSCQAPICIVENEPRYVDIQKQIRICLERHETCRQAFTKLDESIPLFLIDCEGNTVVRRGLDTRYLTLSYVWGEGAAQDADLALHNFSIAAAPKSVRDAIELTRRLGERYLWVDRHCIDQNNITDKHKNLHNMHHIYERSIATIVALHGQDYHAGLPGISNVPRRLQSSYRTKEVQLVSSLPPISSLVADSFWNTRGWTYQEARLATRCLFVTEHQIYMVCRQSTWSESLPYDPEVHAIAKLLNSSRLDHGLFGREFAIPNGFALDRLQFTQRNLTYASDILDAFRGALQRCGFVTFWGIPVKRLNCDTDPSSGFALGLAWRRRPSWTVSKDVIGSKRTNGTRRDGFPTWSWTSLIADIYQDNFYAQRTVYSRYLEGQDVVLPNNEALTKFSLRVDDQWQPLNDSMWNHGKCILPEQSACLLVEGEFVTLTYKSRGRTRQYLLGGKWRFFQPDVPHRHDASQGRSTSDESECSEEVFVLIQWHDTQQDDKRRLILMLLDWVDDEHAVRRGILTVYRDHFDTQWIAELPRSRRSFILT